MSAYIVDRHHILYLIAAALQAERGSDFYYYHEGKSHRLDRCDYESAADAANMLRQENINSIQHRYPDTQDSLENAPGPIGETFVIRESEINPFAFRIDPVQVLKSISCYEYQSCEHPEWEASEAFAFVDALRSTYIAQLPGYDDAEWGAPEPLKSQGGRLVSLIGGRA